MQEFELFKVLAAAIVSLTRDLPEPEHVGRCRGDAGYTTEAIICIAGLAGLAILVLAIVVNKVTTAANGIQT